MYSVRCCPGAKKLSHTTGQRLRLDVKIMLKWVLGTKDIKMKGGFF
jgi:hypothetical protein